MYKVQWNRSETHYFYSFVMFAVIELSRSFSRPVILSSSLRWWDKTQREKKRNHRTKAFELNNDLLIGPKALMQWFLNEKCFKAISTHQNKNETIYKHHFRSVTFVFIWLIIDFLYYGSRKELNSSINAHCVDFSNWVFLITFDWIISSMSITFCFPNFIA